MFHYDPSSAARTQRVFSMMDNQIDEWKRRFGPLSASDELKRQQELRRSRQQENTSGEGAQQSACTSSSCVCEAKFDQLQSAVAHLSHELQKSQSDVKAALVTITNLVQSNAALTKSLDESRSDVVQAKIETHDLQRRVDNLDRTVSSLLHQRSEQRHECCSVERGSTQLCDLLSTVMSKSHFSFPKQSDDQEQISFEHRLRALECESEDASNKRERMIETIVARTVDSLRDELLLAGRRPVELRSTLTNALFSSISKADAFESELAPGEQAAADRKRAADEQAAADRKRAADEQAAADRKRTADEQAAADRKRAADEQAAADRKRTADEQAAADRKRAADEQAAADRKQADDDFGVPPNNFDDDESDVDGGVDPKDFVLNEANNSPARSSSSSSSEESGAYRLPVRAAPAANSTLSGQHTATNNRGILKMLTRTADVFDDDTIPITATTPTITNLDAAKTSAAKKPQPHKLAALQNFADDFDF